MTSIDVASPEVLEPVALGPSWQKADDGQWLLPEFSLGFHIFQWLEEGWLRSPDGGPQLALTPEQSRLLVWWYAVDAAGRFSFRDGVIQRIKGWGKDPFAAVVSAIELVGPCRFSHFEGRDAIGKPHPSAWIQIAAVSKDQTRNTMTLFPSLFSAKAIDTFGIDLGKEIIYAYGGSRRIEAVTSSPRALEGGRPTFTLKNETQHWLPQNEGHDMAAVIDRNAAKSADGSARALSITNAPDPSEDSVALREREAFDLIAGGKSIARGLMFDSLEAPHLPLAVEPVEGESKDDHAQRTRAHLGAMVRAARGDSAWLDVDRIVDSMLDPRRPPSESRRFWLNQTVATEDAWVDPVWVRDTARPDLEHAPSDGWVLFFDGSKSDDSTAAVACRLSDGHLVTVGVWERPPGARGEGWVVDRFDVDQEVRAVLADWSVRAFWADPSHAKAEDGHGFWDSVIDGWHRDFGEGLSSWAVQSGPRRHSILWDMSNSARLEMFTGAAMALATDLRDGLVTHDGHPRLEVHMRNARRHPNRWGVSIVKDHRESSRKIDLAVAAVGARLLRRVVLNQPEPAGGKQPGRVWGG